MARGPDLRITPTITPAGADAADAAADVVGAADSRAAERTAGLWPWQPVIVTTAMSAQLSRLADRRTITPPRRRSPPAPLSSSLVAPIPASACPSIGVKRWRHGRRASAALPRPQG